MYDYCVILVPKPWSVLRGTWFEVSSSERWYPVNEKDSALLEEAHTRKDWREKVCLSTTNFIFVLG